MSLRLFHGRQLYTQLIKTNTIKRVSLHTSKISLQDQSCEKKPFELTFDEYVKLKSAVKTKQRIAGVPFAFIGMACSSFTTAYLYPDMFDATPENVQLIMGLDPLVFSGVSGVAAAGVGYIIGTNLFKLLWKSMNKQKAEGLLNRDMDFLQRLDKYRFGADSKFEDDYYGETIKTLSDYRQWVRTQQTKKKNYEKFQLQSNKTENPA